MTSSNLIILCKDIRKLEPNHKSSDIINGSFKITALLAKPNTWYDCSSNVAFPEIIGHYLNLNHICHSKS